MRTAIVAIIERENDVLIGKKIKKEGHIFDGGWHIPGGKVNAGESEEKAVRREMLEETGLRIKVEKLLTVSEQPERSLVVKWFLCSSKTSDLKAGDDLEEVKFVSKSEALKLLHKTAIKVWPEEVKRYMYRPNR